LRQRESELQAMGARLVFVGSGAPHMAAAFAKEHAGPFTVLSDVARKTFQAAGMKRGLVSTLRLRLLFNAARAMRAGFRQGKVQGDPWQQGGVLVFDRGGALVYQQLDAVGGDALDLDAVVAAVRGAAAVRA
jgi:hypothetical protein